jgi:uncharacterized protein YjiS (DUF1127 family)
VNPNSGYAAAVPQLVQAIHGWRRQIRETGLLAGLRPAIERELADLGMLILRIAPRPERLH